MSYILTVILVASGTNLFFSHKSVDILQLTINQERIKVASWLSKNKLLLKAKKTHNLITRDDVVKQRHKFGSNFFRILLGSKKLPVLFNFLVSRARPEKLCNFYFAATSNHVQVRLDCTSRKQILRQEG